ncbi:MAG TPA: hypothetical protein VL749_07535 [Patescibacteria group bacterium]|nr:hypothetical protein [Patescibacteria group bacterium]
MAGLTRPALLATGGLLLLSLLALVPGAAGAAAADPAAGASPRPPTCTERFPAEGPAGVDLRLGCIVSEVIGLWRPSQTSPPPPLSAYAVAVGILAMALIALGLVAARLLARRAGQRLAPVTPEAWWVCPSCHSINGVGTARCYNCALPAPDDISTALLPTSDQPVTPQSFGRGKHG